MEKLFYLTWPVPFGAFTLNLDSLSLVFLVPVMVLLFCAGIYAVGYLRPYFGKRSLIPHLFFYVLLSLALVVIVTANNVILFLGAWETMTLTTYFLITFLMRMNLFVKPDFYT